MRLGNRVFVGPNASFTNDKFPRSKQYPAAYLQTLVEDDASIGANATVLPGVKIGIGAMIGAGAVVTKDVPARAIVAGNPGRVVGYAGAAEIDDRDRSLPADFGAGVIRLGGTDERRGRLFVADDGTVPFVPKRFFLVDKVPVGEQGAVMPTMSVSNSLWQPQDKYLLQLTTAAEHLPSSCPGRMPASICRRELGACSMDTAQMRCFLC